MHNHASRAQRGDRTYVRWGVRGVWGERVFVVRVFGFCAETWVWISLWIRWVCLWISFGVCPQGCGFVVNCGFLVGNLVDRHSASNFSVDNPVDDYGFIPNRLGSTIGPRG